MSSITWWRHAKQSSSLPSICSNSMHAPMLLPCLNLLYQSTSHELYRQYSSPSVLRIQQTLGLCQFLMAVLRRWAAGTLAFLKLKLEDGPPSPSLLNLALVFHPNEPLAQYRTLWNHPSACPLQENETSRFYYSVQCFYYRFILNKMNDAVDSA